MHYQSGYLRMRSSNKMSLGFTLLLAGCMGGGGGYGDAPRIAAPSANALDMPSNGQSYPTDSYPQQGTLQDEYPTEPGYQPPPEAPPVYQPAPRTAPGAPYAQPDARGRKPAAPYRAPPPQQQPYQQPAYQSPADVPPAVAASTGPRGTSGEQQRYDAVGYAGWYGDEMGGGRTASGQPFNPDAITAAHRTLPLGSFVEITSLDTGRTIIALVNDRGPVGPDREIDLSRGAAQQLGLNGSGPVRVRLITPPAADQMALRSGRQASARIDAPQSLLAALRRKLPARSAAAAPPVRPATRPVRPLPAPPAATRPAPGATYTPPATTRPAPPVARPAPNTSGLYVQVVALSNEAKAQALATQLQGRVQRLGSIYRVQIGPYANNALAQRARDDAARRGYGDARIVQTN